MKNNIKISFVSLFIVAMTLMCASLITIRGTFAYSTSSYKTWDVYLNNLYDTSEVSNAILSNNRIDANISIGVGENYKIYVTLNNDGNIDAKLNEIKESNLNNIKIGTSTTSGKTYYVSDYVDVSIIYDDESTVKTNELLYAGNKIGIIISFNCKDLNSLSEDEINVLDEYLTLRNITFNYYVELNYGENK